MYRYPVLAGPYHQLVMMLLSMTSDSDKPPVSSIIIVETLKVSTIIVETLLVSTETVGTLNQLLKVV